MRKSVWLLSAGLFALAAPVHAQDADPAPTPETESPTEAAEVEEEGDEQVIVITAQGRSQILQDVPIAVTAVGGEAMQNSGATDLRQLNQLVPSLLVSSTGSEANGSARIRGIGTVGDNPGLESSVAVFIDGVYRSRSGIGLNELGEIDRVEVLRGPQGTLFGRNASAGLINIISKKPSFTFGGYGEFTIGNYDLRRLAAGITGPLSETLALRLDAVGVKRDGFYDVVNAAGGTEGDVNDRNRLFTRGQLLFEPNDALSVRLIGDYTNRDESCCGAVNTELREVFDPTPGSPGDFSTAASNRIVNILSLPFFGGIFPSAGDPYNRNIAVTPGRTYRNETTDWGISGQVDYDFGGATLTSITGYRGYKSGGAGDLDYGNVDIAYRDDDGNSFRRFKTFSQELRLRGSAFEDKLDWLVGGYFSHEKLRVSDNFRFGTQYGPFAACRALAGSAVAPSALVNFFNPALPGCLSPTGRAVVSGLVPGGPPPAFGAATPALLAGLDRLSSIRDLGDVSSIYDQTSRNFALFTHNIFHVTDQLDVTLGARYTKERKELETDFNNNNTVCPVQQAALGPLLANPALAPTVGGIIILSCVGNSSSALNSLDLRDDFSEGEFTGTAVLSYKPTDDWLLYASYSRGYKAGGYNLDRSDLGSAAAPRSNADAQRLRFAPEINNAYEAGFKYTGRGFSFNAALFHQRFDDFQLNTFNGLVFIVQNINSCDTDLAGADQDASAVTGACSEDDVRSGVTSRGLELETFYRPMRDLQLTGGYTYVDTKYRKNLIGSSSGEALDPALFLLAGQNLSNAPKHVATGSLTWTPDIGGRGLSGLFYVDGRYTSKFNTGSDLFPEKEQEGFFLMNARVGVRGPNENWAVELWAQNLLDKQYQQVAFNAPFQSSSGSNGTVAQVIRFGSPGSAIANQIYGSFLAEPRTYGLTVRAKFAAPRPMPVIEEAPPPPPPAPAPATQTCADGSVILATDTCPPAPAPYVPPPPPPVEPERG